MITLIIYVKFKVITAVIFWAVTLCRRFRGTCCLHVQNRRVSQHANNNKLADWHLYLLQGQNWARKLQTSRKIIRLLLFRLFGRLMLRPEHRGSNFLRNVCNRNFEYSKRNINRLFYIHGPCFPSPRVARRGNIIFVNLRRANREIWSSYRLFF